MRKQIARISILQTSKIGTLLYVVIGLIYVPIGFAMMIFGRTEMKVMGIVYMLMPILMGLFGFIFIVIGAAIYNLAARWVGGVEFTVKDVEEIDPPQPAHRAQA